MAHHTCDVCGKRARHNVRMVHQGRTVQESRLLRMARFCSRHRQPHVVYMTDSKIPFAQWANARRVAGLLEVNMKADAERARIEFRPESELGEV